MKRPSCCSDWFCCLRFFSQDIQVREEAVRLPERANAVSSAPNLPNLERTDTLRVFGADPIQEAPPEIIRLMRITPIALVRFDHEDVIHSTANR
jgi:hypothetical protein